jgi:threonine aldolase
LHVELAQVVQSLGGRGIEDVVADKLREQFRFYDWDPARRERRWMCAFDTTEADVDAFVTALRGALAS